MKEMRPADELQLSEEQKLLQTQALIPSTLPSVAYNEFVFGHLLGEGSFSQVRYAKRIVKGCTASQWPEFAVKVVDRELIRQQRYEENVEREQRIMAGFHHPNVTSLVATCSNDHHLYFVLEYAAKGDLHTHIAALGSFSVPTTRFIAAEILRGIQHLHSLHVIWGDCKPENVGPHTPTSFPHSLIPHSLTRTIDPHVSHLPLLSL
jgi:serine/threonine protein kinase